MTFKGLVGNSGIEIEVVSAKKKPETQVIIGI
jgi:hypothetical protein